MTKRAFLMSICEVYGTYNKAMGQLVADYLDRYDEAELQILFDFTTTEFSHVYGKVPDKAKFEELRKKYNDAHQFDPIGVGFKRSRKQLEAPAEDERDYREEIAALLHDLAEKCRKGKFESLDREAT
jgi:hypothetical protein